MPLVPDKVQPLLDPICVTLQMLILRRPLMDIQNNLLEVLDRCFPILQEIWVVNGDLDLELSIHVQFRVVVGGSRHFYRFVKRLSTFPRVVENGCFISPVIQAAHILLI